jgi:hypothetical protein
MKFFAACMVASLIVTLVLVITFAPPARALRRDRKAARRAKAIARALTKDDFERWYKL